MGQLAQRSAAALIVAGLIAAGTTTAAPQAGADPGTVARFGSGASVTRFNGAAFDTCTAPPLSAMKAWRASSYRAVAVYVGGVNRTCAQPNLTRAWVTAITAMGWRLMPVHMGLQPDCSDRATSKKISPTKADDQGADAAADSIKQVTALGLQPGSAVYLDIEHYDALDNDCRKAVLKYVSGYTREMHRRGYVAGVYANLASGAQHLAGAHTSTGYARPDALWVARWDGSRTLTGLTGVPDTVWNRYQRAKQYRGPHFETHGGVRLHIDSNWVNAPVATVSRPYKVTRPATARNGPALSASERGKVSTGSIVDVVCQTPGSVTNGTPVWNLLENGSYISDFRLATPSSTGRTSPIPPCYYAYQVVSDSGLSKRSGPGVSFTRDGQLDDGALAWVTCQAMGSQVGSSGIWDRIDTGLFVSDYYVTSPSRSTYSPPIPRCTN